MRHVTTSNDSSANGRFSASRTTNSAFPNPASSKRARVVAIIPSARSSATTRRTRGANASAVLPAPVATSRISSSPWSPASSSILSRSGPPRCPALSAYACALEPKRSSICALRSGVSLTKGSMRRLEVLHALLEGVPGEHRALDADGVLHNAFQRDEVAEGFVVDVLFPGHQTAECQDELLDLLEPLS